jgi:hypothetical protein
VDGLAHRALVDAEVTAQVEPALGLFLPGVAERRWRPVPLFDDDPDIELFLQAADPELLAVHADQGADRGKRGTGSVGVDGRVVEAEHPPVREDWHDQLEKSPAHCPPHGT